MKRNLLTVIAFAVLIEALATGCSVATGKLAGTTSTTFLPNPSSTPTSVENVFSPGDKTPSAGLPTHTAGESVTFPGGALSSTTGSPTPEGKEKGMDWQIYRDDTYGYEIRYPPNYLIQKGAQQKEPQPLQQIHFQDRELAQSDTASLQPPQLSIEVFDNSSRLPLEKWLKEHRVLESWMKFQVEPYSLSGALGVRLSSQLLLAPNEFIYLPHGPYVFKLTPLGEFSEQMLATFKFIM